MIIANSKLTNIIKSVPHTVVKRWWISFVIFDKAFASVWMLVQGLSLEREPHYLCKQVRMIYFFTPTVIFALGVFVNVDIQYIPYCKNNSHTVIEIVCHSIEHAGLCSRICCCVNAGNQAKLFFGHGTNVIVQTSKYSTYSINNYNAVVYWTRP